jgi:hypothetical protein
MNNLEDDSFADLTTFLATMPPGPLHDTADLERLLNACWDAFEGHEDEGMTPEKLLGRMEKVEWQPPVLTFVIERHGRICQGSSRANLHRWTVNIEARTASCEKIGHRQLHPMARRLDLRGMAEEIAGKIIRGEPDDRLRWHADGTVQVLASKALPSDSFQQTIEGRRRRLRQALVIAVEKAGWWHLERWRFGPKMTASVTKGVMAA